MQKYSRYSIKFKITAVSVTITLIIAIVTVSVCYFSFMNPLKNNLIQTTEFGLQVAVDSISEKMNNIMLLPSWSNTSSLITSALYKGSAYSNSQRIKTYDRLLEEYMNNGSTEYINRLMIGNFRGDYMQILKDVNVGSANDYQAVCNLSYFNTLLDSDKYEWIGIAEDELTVYKKPTIPIIRPIYSNFSNARIGWIYIAVLPTIITDALNSYTVPSDSNLYFTINEITYKLAGNELLPVIDNYLSVKELESDTVYDSTRTFEIIDSDNRHRTVITCPSSIDGWYISQILSDAEISAQHNTFILILVSITLAIVSLGLIMTMLLNRFINSPVKAILKKVKAISSGDFSAAPEIETADELGQIGRGINELSTNVVQLMDKRVDAEKQQRELEYQILQSQINPHFLYNTLNSIKWMATIQNATGIAEMTTALSRLLKNISKGTKQMIPLSEELALLKDYALIQEYRYGGVVTISYNIPEEFESCIIPKLSLQPLVENAIFHGIEAKGSDGQITVTAEKTGSDLLLTVEDNGIGMSKELIDAIMSGKEDKSGDSFRKVGISNVHSRVRYAYSESKSASDKAPIPNERYGITIESEPGCYTRMSLLIPFINSDDYYAASDS